MLFILIIICASANTAMSTAMQREPAHIYRATQALKSFSNSPLALTSPALAERSCSCFLF
jgi:hypothetical protein